jgi:hypothetical protein
LPSFAVTLSICTVKETTLAMGASVPVTNDAPVSVEVVVVVVEFMPAPVLQPANTSAALAAATTRVADKKFTSLFGFISAASSLFLCRKILKCREAHVNRGPPQGRQLKPGFETRTGANPHHPLASAMGFSMILILAR